MITSRWIVIGRALTVLGACVAISGCPPEPVNPNLFLDDPPPEELVKEQSPRPAWVSSSRIARLNVEHFFDRAFEPTSGALIRFNLPDQKPFDGAAERHNPVGTGTVIWHGRSSDGDVLRIAFAISGRTISGEVRTLESTTRITPITGDWHSVEKIDDLEFPPEGDPIDSGFLPPNDKSTAVAVCDPSDIGGPIKPPDQIRILFAYTQPAANRVNVNVFTDLLIDQLTTVWSGPNYQVIPQVAHVVTFSDSESGSSLTNLNRIQGKTDGYFDQVHALRDTYKADLVTLITEGGDYCGYGNLPYPPDRSNANAAFTTVARGCAYSNLSLAHELGHNLSMGHDRYVKGPIPGRHNYGYTNLNLRVRTVMAYPNECESHSNGLCPRIPEYSHPHLWMKSERIGVPIGNAKAAHNRNMLCWAAPAVARYR